MKKTWTYILIPAAVLLASMVYLLLAGERDAETVREQVVRFHVVAASDSAADQALKIKVRDGVFSLVKELFSDCSDGEEALETARVNQAVLEAEAERILRESGCKDGVTLEIGDRYFPTKAYGALSFPPGIYRAVSIRIGDAEGQNFWCVLYPALCIAPAVAAEQAEEELAAVVGGEGTDFLKRSTEKQRIKFALVEWFEKIIKIF